MKNETNSITSELASSLSEKEVAHATFIHNGTHYTFAPGMDSIEFMQRFINPETAQVHSRISGMLSSSGSGWDDKAFVFCIADCMEPPLYLQFGSSFEDAHESFCDNAVDSGIKIEDSEMADYMENGDENTFRGSFTSDGVPIDTDNVQGFGPLSLVSITFKA